MMHRQNQTSLGRVFETAPAFLKPRPALFAGLTAAVLLCALGMKYSFATDDSPASSPQASSNSSVTAIRNFWSIYHGNRYSAIPQAQDQLQRAIQLDPNNPTLYALLGATHFWHVGEFARDPKPDMSVLQQDMPTAASLFQKALSLDYYAPHLTGYINDDHLPGYLGITTVHTGQEFHDPNLIAKGDAMLDFAVYQFPEFNNFNRWAAHNTDSRDSATYKEALDSLWQGIDNCIGGAIDRNHPDMKPYLDLVTSVGRKKACWWEGDIAPYSFEGYILNLGNGLVKAGQIDAARIIFADAKYAANYSTWPYRDVLETIAASDLNARAALYADADSSNDPPLSVPNRSCVYCHATVPESVNH
jgi:tetratricopeptide (TPR) repeat protein